MARSRTQVAQLGAFPLNGDSLVRWLSRHDPNGEGCWDWTGRIDPGGYGRFDIGDSTWLAHRVSYMHTVGSIPDDKQIDHVCRNTACVNPAHLEVVTGAENQRRKALAKTHCKHGHEFTPENTRLDRHRSGWVVRACRACQRKASRKYQASKGTP